MYRGEQSHTISFEVLYGSFDTFELTKFANLQSTNDMAYLDLQGHDAIGLTSSDLYVNVVQQGQSSSHRPYDFWKTGLPTWCHGQMGLVGIVTKYGAKSERCKQLELLNRSWLLQGVSQQAPLQPL